MTTLPMPGDPAGWLVVYGSQHQYRCLILDRARAEQQAAHLERGVIYPLVVAGDMRAGTSELVNKATRCAGGCRRCDAGRS